VRRGETPAAWEQKPAKNRQKDKDARWTKKHGKSFFGYKNHVNADKAHKLIRDYEVTDAAVHDSRVLEALLDEANTNKDVFGDSAYRSAENEEKLAARGFRSGICVRGTRGHPLSKAKTAANRAKSCIRARIEHVFGAQESAPGGRLVRTIGIVRARAKIGLQNFVYNIRRLATLDGFFEQFDRLHAWANRKHGNRLAATFLCGDFNIKAGSEGYQAVVRTCEYEDQYLAATSPNVFQKIFRQQSPNIDRHLVEDGRIDFIFMQKHTSLQAAAARELFTNGDHYGRVSDHTGYCVEFEPNW
jgi:IS5 family transposase